MSRGAFLGPDGRESPDGRETPDGPDVLGNEEGRPPPRALRRAAIAVLGIVLLAAYGPDLARSSGASRLLSSGTPRPPASAPATSSAPSATQSPSSSPTRRIAGLPPGALSSPEEASPASMLGWPVRGDLAADRGFAATVRQAVSRTLPHSGPRRPRPLWAGTVPGGRLALVAELTGTGGVSVTALHFPQGVPASQVVPEPAGAVYDGNSSLVGWVGPMVRRHRGLVVLGPPRSLLLGVSSRSDPRRDGSAPRRWQSYSVRKGALVTELDEPVNQPVLVRRPATGSSALLRLGFDPGRVPRSADLQGSDPVAYRVADTGRYLP